MSVMYFGGMILGNINDHYIYEEALARFIAQRIEMFEKDTFWAKHRSALSSLEKITKFPDDAYYHIPEDPLISIPFPDLRVMLLKRKYLNRLRQTLLKYFRRGKSVPHVLF